MTATVRYQINGLAGSVAVNCEQKDSDQMIIDQAKFQVKRKYGYLPMGYQKFSITSKR